MNVDNPINILTPTNETNSNMNPIQSNPNESQAAPLNQTKDDIIIITSLDNEKEKDKDKVSNISTQTHSTNSMKFLTKYKDIYVPSIYLMNYDDMTQPPFNSIKNTTYSQAAQNNPTAIYNKDYINYGYSLEQWKVYANEIKNKFDELNELVKNGKIRLPEPDNELEYIMNFPSDYGGLGRVHNDQNYENVKFYDPKDSQNGNKSFMSLIKFDEKDHQIWFNLEPNPSSLNNNINIGNKINTNSYIPKYFFFPYGYPQTIPTGVSASISDVNNLIVANKVNPQNKNQR